MKVLHSSHSTKWPGSLLPSHVGGLCPPREQTTGVLPVMSGCSYCVHGLCSRTISVETYRRKIVRLKIIVFKTACSAKSRDLLPRRSHKIFYLKPQNIGYIKGTIAIRFL